MTAEQPWTPPPSRLAGSGFSQFQQQPVQPLPSRTSSRRRRLTVIGLVVFIVAALVAGTLMIVAGNTPVAQDAPLPAVPDYVAPADQKPVGPDGVGGAPTPGNPSPGAVKVENADTGGGEPAWNSPRYATPVTMMSTTLMEPMSVFVPAAKMYSLARPSNSFVASKYAGFTSIAIPGNPHRTVWHSAGGAMAGTNADGSPATSGTTFLGSHSGYTGLWGAYVNVAYLKGGETIWTKDSQGKLQRWQVSRIRYMPHQEFPQDYWKADGERRLVLTTCGGTSGADGVYNENVFVEAKPVEADGAAWKGARS